MSAPTTTRPARSPAAPDSTVGTRKPAGLTVPGVLAPSLASWGAVLLSALCLGPLFGESGWIGATLLCVTAVVAVIGVATWLRAPMVLVPLLGAVALFAALVARFTTDAPWGFVPTPTALDQLREVLAAGVADIDRFAPPVPISEGLIAVTALGVGSVALVVAVLQVVLRLPAVAGLPLVAMYIVPSAVLSGGSPWWAFVLVVAGWLLLLATDERLTLLTWGRVLRRSDRFGGSTAIGGLSSSAFRLGAAAVVVALALPIVIPGLADAVLGREVGGPGEGEGDGSSDVPDSVGIDPIVSLRRDLLQQPDVTVLRYRSTDPSPSYLRAIVLEQYDGESWKPKAYDPDLGTPASEGVDGLSGVGASIVRKSYRYEIAAGAYNDRWLPLPEHVTALQVEGDWYVDGSTGVVFGADEGTTTRDRAWTVEASEIEPTRAQLDAAPPLSGFDRSRISTSMPIPDAVRATAAEVVRDAGATTDADAAAALENWFHKEFVYSTKGVRPDSSSDYLTQFLRDKSGYCEQFSATMALMATSLGIPARVVVGFTAGVQPGENVDDEWTVSARNAHAWPELFFSNIGWVRYEPTPASPANGVNTVRPDYTDETSPTPIPTPGDGTDDSVGNPRDQDLASDEATDIPVVDLPEGAGARSDTWRVVAFVLLLVAIAIAALVPAGIRWTRRRRRLADGAGPEAAWAELRDTALDLGSDWSDARTPRQAVAALAAAESLHGEAGIAAERIGRVVERSRYAPTAPDTRQVARDVAAVRHALLERRQRRARLSALLAPASLRSSSAAAPAARTPAPA